jgi:hypothetical protein
MYPKRNRFNLLFLLKLVSYFKKSSISHFIFIFSIDLTRFLIMAFNLFFYYFVKFLSIYACSGLFFYILYLYTLYIKGFFKIAHVVVVSNGTCMFRRIFNTKGSSQKIRNPTFCLKNCEVILFTFSFHRIFSFTRKNYN